MGVPEVSVRVLLPSAPLAGYVTFFYCVDISGPLKDFLYPEWGNVRFALAGEWFVEMPGFPLFIPQDAVLFGPTDRHGAVTTPGASCIGFGLTPLGWHRLIGTDAAAMANRVAHLGDALGYDGERLRRELMRDPDDEARKARLERVLLARLARRPPIAPQVAAVDRALRQRPATVPDFAAAAGMSARTLHRHCLAAFGFAPKRLLRLQRFLDTLGLVRQAVGAKVSEAVGDGYFDASHFYRDFHEFMAMGPQDYACAPHPLMAAATAAQERAGVTLSFRLPDPP